MPMTSMDDLLRELTRKSWELKRAEEKVARVLSVIRHPAHAATGYVSLDTLTHALFLDDEQGDDSPGTVVSIFAKRSGRDRG